jgi:hypothetical protein
MSHQEMGVGETLVKPTLRVPQSRKSAIFTKLVTAHS